MLSTTSQKTRTILQGGWLVYGQRCDLSGLDRQHTCQISLGQSTVGAVSVGLSSHVMELKSKEVCLQYFNFTYRFFFN